MSISVAITNLTAATLPVDELYANLGPNGSATQTLTIVRSSAQLDSMDGLKALVALSKVSLVLTPSSDDTAIGEFPPDQHGSVSMSAASVAMVTSAVTFTTAYLTAPTVVCGVTQDASSSTVRGAAYATLVTTTGFTAALDVTTADTSTISVENPTMSPAENGVLLGPFTATLAKLPITTGNLTLHWAESAVAKTATIAGTSTLGSTNAANLSAASINKTTGALSITFATGHAPDTNTITVDYAQTKTVVYTWAAKN